MAQPTLAPEQQQALDDLLQAVQAHKAAPATQPDWLQTWLGISRQDLRDTIRGLLDHKEAAQSQLLNWVEANPLDASLEFLGVASWVFYQAEKGQNPKIQTYVDAFYYISTCASVGYADIFAATQTGRTVAALVMIVGPALASRSLDRPKPSQISKEK
jgi:hypothetical protein